MERHSPNENEGPLHLLKCAYQLGIMAVKELVYNIDKALDAAWPEDDPEDQTIHSDRWSEAGDDAA